MGLREHPLRSVLLLLVAVPQTATGLWAVVAPRGWYGDFPGLGHAWIPAYGPYDEHLVTDAGAGLLALGLLLGWAAIVARRDALRMACAAFLLFAAVHLSFHLRTLGHLPRVDDLSSIASLGAAVVVPLGVLLSLSRPTPSARPRPATLPPHTAPEVRP